MLCKHKFYQYFKIIENISFNQLSIARYYGGANINGIYYYYDNKTDRLKSDKKLKMRWVKP